MTKSSSSKERKSRVSCRVHPTIEEPYPCWRCHDEDFEAKSFQRSEDQEAREAAEECGLIDHHFID